MAIREVVTLICDRCGTDGEDVVTRPRLVVGRKERQGEACEDCWAPVEELAGVFGR